MSDEDDLNTTKDSFTECCSPNGSEKYNQMTNIMVALFVLLVAFGAMVMLNIIQVTPGTLPLLDQKTWTEIWEHLF